MKRRETLLTLLAIFWVITALAQDKWSPLIRKLDTTSYDNAEYAKLVVGICWQISDLSPDSGLYYCNLGLKIGEEQNRDSITCRSLIGLSAILTRKGKHSDAVETSLKALKIAEQYQDTMSILDATNNIGIDMYYVEDYVSALKYFKRYAEVASQFSDRIQYANALTNVALVEAELGNTENEILNYKQSLDIFKEIGDQRGYANTLFNLGKVYQGQLQYKDAISSYETCADIFLQEEFTVAWCDVITTWSSALFELNQPLEALSKLRMSIQLSKKTKNQLQEQYAYKLAHNIFASLNEYDSAYYYQGKYQELLNESREREKSEYADELIAKYETEKKEQQIEQLEQKNTIASLENDRQKLFNLIYLTLAGILILAVVFIYLRYRDKNKTNYLLDAKNQELARLNQTKDQLFSIISHDLRSPLSSFHTITKSLADNWENLEKDQLKDFIVTLRDSSSDVKNMMDNLLKWALSQTNQLAYKPSQIQSDKIVEEVKSQLKSVSDLRQVGIRLELKSVESIRADRDFLQIIIRNLLSNALKFSKMHSEINVIIDQMDGCQVISIADQGVGMEQSQIDQLFAGQINAQDIQNSTEKGTGLGLTLCKELMSKMNGKIEVQSEIGKGTIFKLIFANAA